MDVTSDSLSLLILLVPGFLSSRILDQLIVRPRMEPTGRISEALVFSFLNYAILSGVFRVPVYDATASGIRTNAGFALSAIPISLLLPALAGWLSTRDIHMKLLRFLGATSRTARGLRGWTFSLTNNAM